MIMIIIIIIIVFNPRYLYYRRFKNNNKNNKRKNNRNYDITNCFGWFQVNRVSFAILAGHHCRKYKKNINNY